MKTLRKMLDSYKCHNWQRRILTNFIQWQYWWIWWRYCLCLPSLQWRQKMAEVSKLSYIPCMEWSFISVILRKNILHKKIYTVFLLVLNLLTMNMWLKMSVSISVTLMEIYLWSKWKINNESLQCKESH